MVPSSLPFSLDSSADDAVLHELVHHLVDFVLTLAGDGEVLTECDDAIDFGHGAAQVLGIHFFLCREHERDAQQGYKQ